MEAPQIHWYAEQLLAGLVGQTLVKVEGERASQAEPFVGRRLIELLPRGKVLFLRFEGLDDVLRLHCLMFGDVRLNRERPGKRITIRLSFEPESGSLGSSNADHDVVTLTLGAARRYGPEEPSKIPIIGDPMSDAFDGTRVINEAARDDPKAVLADVLLDQERFPGLGNKIRTESLFRARLHPLQTVGSLSKTERDRLAVQIHDYTRLFFEAVAEHGDHADPPYRIYRKKVCPECAETIVDEKLGQTNRRCHVCPNCQTIPIKQ